MLRHFGSPYVSQFLTRMKVKHLQQSLQNTYRHKHLNHNSTYPPGRNAPLSKRKTPSTPRSIPRPRRIRPGQLTEPLLLLPLALRPRPRPRPHRRLPGRVAPVARQHAGLVEGLLRVAVAGGPARLLRVGLGALGDGHHGRPGPDVDGLGPVQAVQAAALYRDYVLVLWVVGGW